MSKKLLIRDVPDRVVAWIDDSRQQNRISQNQLLLAILDRAADGDLTPSLFEQRFLRIPIIVIVGLPDAAVRESQDRVSTALTSSGFKF